VEIKLINQHAVHRISARLVTKVRTHLQSSFNVYLGFAFSVQKGSGVAPAPALGGVENAR
jgi:hypothetical protein